MTQPLIIGLIALKGTGKTTTAEAIKDLVENTGYTCARLPMASPLKEGVKTLFSWDDRHVYGDLKQEVCPSIGVTPRYAQQTLGTEWGRGLIDTNVWPKAMQRLIETKHQDTDVVVVDDIRFDNEVEWVQRMGGVNVLLTRAECHEPLPDAPARLMHMLRGSRLLKPALEAYMRLAGASEFESFLHESEHLAYRLTKGYPRPDSLFSVNMDLNPFPEHRVIQAARALRVAQQQLSVRGGIDGHSAGMLDHLCTEVSAREELGEEVAL